jgi:recombination protein RecT
MPRKQTRKQPTELVQDRFVTVQEVVNKENIKTAVRLALPAMPGDKDEARNRMMRIWLTAVRQNRNLTISTIESLLASLLEAAQLGLEPDGILGQAYLIPYKNGRTGKYEANLQIGYRGFISLAFRSGQISYIASELVYENDLFDIDQGTARRIEHKPNLSNDRGEITGAYSVVRFRDGSVDFEYMSRKEIDAIKNRSMARGQESPWQTDYPQMARKSPIRRHAKRLPLSPDIIRAAVADEYREVGVVPKGLMPTIEVAGLLTEPESDEKEEKVPGPSPAAAAPREEAATESAAPAQVTLKIPKKGRALLPAYIYGELPQELTDQVLPGMNWHPEGDAWCGPQNWIKRIKEELTERGIEWKEE